MADIPEDAPNHHILAFGSDPVPYVPENVEKVFENLAVTIHVGWPQRDNTIIGWANAWRNKEDGTSTIVIGLDEEPTRMLGDLAEVFQLYSLGFAGRKYQPEKKQ